MLILTWFALAAALVALAVAVAAAAFKRPSTRIDLTGEIRLLDQIILLEGRIEQIEGQILTINNNIFGLQEQGANVANLGARVEAALRLGMTKGDEP